MRNFKKHLILTLLIAHFSFLIISCGNPFLEQVLEPKTITFNSNGGSAVSSQTVLKGKKISKPANPKRNNHSFEGWFLDDASFDLPWNFGDIPTGDITLYANWEFTGTITNITSIDIFVIIPAIGVTPNTVATGTGNFTIGTVSWDPAHNPFQANTQYTATVTLTAHEGFVFDESIFAAISGQPSIISNNTGDKVTLSSDFPPTTSIEITAINIITVPKLDYTHGDILDLSDMEADLTYANSLTSGPIPYEDFILHGLTVNPPNNTALSRALHDGTDLTVSNGLVTNNELKLTIGKADPVVTWDTVITAISGQQLWEVPLTPFRSDVPGTFTWTNPNNPVGAPGPGTVAHSLTFTPANTVNYNTLTLVVDIVVSNASGASVGVPTLNSFSTTSITINPVTEPGNSQSVQYAIDTSNTAAANTLTWQSGEIFSGLLTGTIYYVYARSAQNSFFDAGPPSVSAAILFNLASFTITIAEITDLDEVAVIDSNITLSRSGAGDYLKTASINAAGISEYNIQWLYNGTLIGSADLILICIDPDDTANYNINYDIIGIHLITLILERDGAWYSKRIQFEVIE